MKDYTGWRKKLKEAGYQRCDRNGKEVWFNPASNQYLIGYRAAVRSLQRRLKKSKQP